ncbi:PDCD5-related protein [Usnea florida]
MSDADLEEIRKGRLAQLQQQQQPGGTSGGGGDENQRKQQEAEARTSILAQVLTPEAADRLGRIRLVKESRATDIENRLIMLARSGQLRSKVTEEQLKEFLGAMTENAEKSGGGGGGRIVITRRKEWDDDDDLFDL